jgi:hypothetical protein
MSTLLKKVSDFPVPSQDVMSQTKLFLAGKIVNLFCSVHTLSGSSRMSRWRANWSSLLVGSMARREARSTVCRWRQARVLTGLTCRWSRSWHRRSNTGRLSSSTRQQSLQQQQSPEVLDPDSFFGSRFRYIGKRKIHHLVLRLPLALV